MSQDDNAAVEQKDSGADLPPAFPEEEAPPAETKSPEELAKEYEYEEEGAEQPEVKPEDEKPGEKPGAEQPEVKPEDEKPGEKPGEFSSELVARAKEAGYSEEAMKGFGTPENLETALRAYDKMLSDLGQQAMQREQLQQQAQQQVQGQQQATAPPPAGAQQPPAEKFEFKLDPDVFHEDLGKQLNAFKEYVDGMFQSRFGPVNEVLDKFHQQEIDTFEAKVDGYFGALGEEYVKLFGKGPTATFAEGDALLLNRDKVLDQAVLMHNGYRSLGKKVPPIEQLLKRATDIIFSDFRVNKAVEEIEGSVTKRKSQMLNRPGGGKKKGTPPGDQKASEYAEKFYRDKGFATESGGTADEL